MGSKVDQRKKVMLWRYVIATNAGVAPNYDPPFVTLALCKPKVRKGAQKGDIIIAFEGSGEAKRCNRSWNPNRLIWAGVVADKLTFSEYWNAKVFERKKPHKSPTPDNIYKPVRAGYERVENPSHGERSKATDLGGKFVLVMSPAWCFDETELPARFRHLNWELPNRRGHRTDEIDGRKAEALKDWLKANSSKRLRQDHPRARKLCA